MADPHTLTDAQRRAIRADRLPSSLADALENLNADTVLAGAMGALLPAYNAVKRLDVEDFAGQDEAFELRQHIYKY
jgi:glutamine synthetase